MPTVHFGTKDEKGINLVKSKDLIAVRTKSQRSLRAGPVLSSAAATLDDSQLVLAFPEAGVEVYKVPQTKGVRTLAARKEALRASPDVRFAGGVLVDEKSKEPVVYTENIFIKFKNDVSKAQCNALITEAGLRIKRELDYAINAYFVEAPEGTGTRVFEIAQALLQKNEVEFCHPEVIRKRDAKAIGTRQWHLKPLTIDTVRIDASAHVEAAHLITKGEGITIAIIDDGIDIDHEEFSSPGKITAPRDVTYKVDDPRPKDPNPFYPENHGTACAGVACADGRHHASGVAPKARLLPIRLSSALGSQAEADAFIWAANNGADVISCSWGPVDGAWWDPKDPAHKQEVPIPASTRLAIDYAARKGRDGKGCVIFFAAGNGNEPIENDGYASYKEVIAVAACNDQSSRSVYSDYGKAVWCSFPSNDFGHQETNHPEPLTTGIWTTDRTGTFGYNNGSTDTGDGIGHYTNSFGGTSSACPGAAGVAALILSVHPGLPASEVRSIIMETCDVIDEKNGKYNNKKWSKYYGYGRINAERAVKLAQLIRDKNLKTESAMPK